MLRAGILDRLRSAALSRWWHPFGYVMAEVARVLRADLADLPMGVAALDYGCGETQFRRHLPDHCRYVGADLAGNPHADVELRPDGGLPLPDETFDLVLSKQVLEHVPDPDLYLRESLRVLKPGGRLLLSTHGLMFYHPVPDDFWRWTASGLREQVETSGFRVRSLEGVVGLVPTAIWLVSFKTSHRLPRGIRQAFVLACNLLMAILDRMTSRSSKVENACVYAVAAVKPA